MRLHLLYFAIVSFIINGCCKPGASDIRHTNNQADDSFVVAAAALSLDMMDIAELAMVQSANPAVRNFADSVQGYFNTVYAKLAWYSVGRNTLPTEISESGKMKRSDLNNREANSFDSTYILLQVDQYTKAIGLFRHEITNGQYNMLVNYSNQVLPQLLSQRETAIGILQTK